MTKAETKTLLQLQFTIHRIIPAWVNLFPGVMRLSVLYGLVLHKLKQADGIRRIIVSYALDAILRRCSAEEPYSPRCMLVNPE